MPLPALSNWTQTRVGLHQTAQVIGAINRTVAEPLPNWLHLTLRVIPEGLITRPLPFGGELVLDFAQRAIRYTGDPAVTVPLAGHTQVGLADALLAALANAGHPLSPDRSKLTGNTPLTVDAQTAEDYAWVLHRVYSGLARFHAGRYGWMSAAGVWPHGFDLSFLWFPKGNSEEHDPHLNYGFSPGSPGFDRPYFYAYAHPLPEGLLETPLPPLARWYTGSWTGVVVNYDDLVGESDIEGTIERTFAAIHAAVVPLLVASQK
ncbi:MAG: hypothetical protein H6672_21175 [Anaerolineaceae bacterium]|nr:hypothetical protein [Anaerolineaceae bacterium]